MLVTESCQRLLYKARYTLQAQAADASETPRNPPEKVAIGQGRMPNLRLKDGTVVRGATQ